MQDDRVVFLHGRVGQFKNGLAHRGDILLHLQRQSDFQEGAARELLARNEAVRFHAGCHVDAVDAQGGAAGGAGGRKKGSEGKPLQPPVPPTPRTSPFPPSLTRERKPQGYPGKDERRARGF